MLRNLTFVMAVIVAVIPGNVSAQDVDLHNGYIVVRNETVITEHHQRGFIDRAPVVIRLNGTLHESARVSSGGGTVYLNDCCILAGTLYDVELYVMGQWIRVAVRPQSCNVRGIPHGYALVTFTGTATRDRYNNRYVDVRPHVPSVPCP